MSFTGEEVEVAWQATLRGGSTEWADVSDHYKKRYIAFANALPVKREGEPIEPKDIREGDRVRGVFLRSPDEDVVIEAVARVDKTAIGGMRIGSYGIGVLDDLRLTSRPKPQLPTEPGSRIKVTKLDGKAGEWIGKLASDGWWALFDLEGEDHRVWAMPLKIEEWYHVELREVNK